jgi:hypothetical protein
MYPAQILVLVVNIHATRTTIETVKCKNCQIKVISKQTTSVKIAFYRVLELVIKQLLSSAVNPEDILDLLPTDIACRLRSDGATTIRDIFRECGPLDSKLKWYSFSPLVLLVQEFGDTRCKQELQEYTKTLQNYLQSRSVVTTSPTQTTRYNAQPLLSHEGVCDTQTNQTASDTNAPTVQVFVDKEWDKKLIDPNSSSEKAYIASLLGTRAEHVHFVQAVGA